MTFVDHERSRLERLGAESRAEARRAAAARALTATRRTCQENPGAVTREDAESTWWTAAKALEASRAVERIVRASPRRP